MSARFNKLFSPETYATIRRDFLRTHFQYLMAAELPGDYDYFLITAGDITLAERFAHLDSVTGFNRFRTGTEHEPFHAALPQADDQAVMGPANAAQAVEVPAVADVLDPLAVEPRL